MNTLTFKVFSPSGEYVAATKRPEEAAMLVAALGMGSEIRTGHQKKHRVWHEGHEAQPSAESYDFVAQTIRARRRAQVAAVHAEQDRIAAAYRAENPA